MKCDELKKYKAYEFGTSYVYNIMEVDAAIEELKGELESRRQAAIDIKLSAEKVLRDLLDCGLIKEWYFNGIFNAVLKADDPHLQIAELKKEVNNLLMQNKELCQALQVMYSAEEYAKLQAENAGLKAANKLLKEHIANGDVSRITWIDEVIELKAKLESAQASMYADVVDANMENRRLRRALYKACANWAHFAVAFFSSYATKKKWHKMEQRCLKKAEEYK